MDFTPGGGPERHNWHHGGNYSWTGPFWGMEDHQANMYPPNMYPWNDDWYPWGEGESGYEGPFGTFSQHGGDYHADNSIPWRINRYGEIDSNVGDWSRSQWRQGGVNPSVRGGWQWGPLSGEPEFGVIDFGGQGYQSFDNDMYGDPSWGYFYD